MNAAARAFPDAIVHLRRIPQARVSLTAAALILGIHALVVATGGVNAHGAWFAALGLGRGELASGGIWRLLSYAFLHGSWLHVGLNAALIVGVGSRIESMAGHAVAVRVMLAGLLAGGLFHVLLAPGLLVGFSGAAVALVLLLVTLSPESRMFPLPVSGKSLGIGIIVAELFLALLNPELGVPYLATLGKGMETMGDWFHIGHACHLGGGLAGWAFGRWLLRPRVSLESLRRERARIEAGKVSRGPGG
jgi:membrane associated rhomboid family serine protease